MRLNILKDQISAAVASAGGEEPAYQVQEPELPVNVVADDGEAEPAWLGALSSTSRGKFGKNDYGIHGVKG